VSVNRLVDELRDLLSVEVEPEYAPPRPGDIKHSLADLSRARAELGYEPLVSLRDGLERTIEHLARADAAAVPDRLLAAD
jgi:nucleoside-diphosphate-sugar epimerase